MRRCCIGIPLLSLFLGTQAAAGIVGEGKDKNIVATRAHAAPIIDGSLDDAIWSRAKSDDRFTQIYPNDGDAPSWKTTVQVAYDDENLYFAIHASDPDPDAISAQLARRDSRIASDFIEIFLDTRHDHDNGYWFRINAGGVLADAEIHDDSRLNLEWGAVWQGKAKIDKEGWSSEIAIPLSSLRFSKGRSPQFGFNVKRGIRRTGEIVQWIYSPSTSAGVLRRAGHILGLETIAPKRTAELRPFAVMRLESEMQQGGSAILRDGTKSFDYTFGADGKLGLTDGLTMDITINPDFGQVEADPVELNLSRFESFFAERRPFFLGGGGLFNTDINLIHSRRIGQRTASLYPGEALRLRDGTQLQVVRTPVSTPILAAARLSGTIGNRVSLNALTAVTGPEYIVASDGVTDSEVEVAPPRNYFAARGKYALGGSSYLGFVTTSVSRLGTSVIPSANHDSHSESVDGRWVREDGMYRAYFQVAASQRVGGTSTSKETRLATKTNAERLLGAMAPLRSLLVLLVNLALPKREVAIGCTPGIALSLPPLT